MSKIIRTPTRVEGGITDHENSKLDEHARLWIKRAFRTDPIDPEKIKPAIRGIYAAAGLQDPIVVIVPSPLVMAFAYGAAATIWGTTTSSATLSATDDATHRATSSATSSATRSATDGATYSATSSATRRATLFFGSEGASEACFEIAGPDGLRNATKWYDAYQGGNMWAGFDCYLTAMRDILGLRLNEHKYYHYWEQAAIHGGFRVMHEKFCLVCDFPEFINIDEDNQPHCETGPSHRWRDGSALYHWHGTLVPRAWIETPDQVDPSEIIRTENVEQRAAGCAILGWPRMAPKLNQRIIDGDPKTDLGALVELTLPGLPEPGRFLMAECPRNGTICEGVPRMSDVDNLPIETAIAAQAWRDCLPQSEYSHAKIRT